MSPLTLNTLIAASGLATGRAATPELACRAIDEAREKAGMDRVGCVLLFLSQEFAADIRPTLTAAARAVGSTQILGCTALGLASDEDWVLDGPAAAALVLAEGHGFALTGRAGPDDLLLTLAAPNAINSTWLAAPGRRFGGVAGDATGHGPYSVFSGGRERPDGHGDHRLLGLEGRVGVSSGFRPLGRPMAVSAAHGFDLLGLDGMAPLAALMRSLPLDGRDRQPPESQLALIATAGTVAATEIIGLLNIEPARVTTTRRLAVGESVQWAWRQPLHAELEMDLMLGELAQGAAPPAFGLMFSSAGRGPGFYGGEDRDWLSFRRHFPGVPLLALYGNGQVSPQHPQAIQDNAAVVGLFWPH
ncbi:FIST N-terminal domain-containing protein [Chitinivorax sp. PXF-14]|uniref:FIST N-terminal domain-containing protein n=1 Tax=Chitinivorax sp. PXF-14 TaxID=3230488 RepID=UPI003465E0E7